MNWLELYGWACVALMIGAHWAESKSCWFILAFAITCLLYAVYGYMIHSWPIVVGEIVWAGASAHKWQHHYSKRHHHHG